MDLSPPMKYETLTQAGFPSKLQNTDRNNFGPHIVLGWLAW